MKKDCGYTRKLLRKYLRGHLFKYEQIRIARHLSACPLCRSELQALRKVADTKQLLRDITPPQGLARMKEGVKLLARLRLLVYRPLWLIAIIGFAVLVYVNVIAPGRHDVEIENLEKSVPLTTAEVDGQTAAPAAGAAVLTRQTSSTSKPAPRFDPLLITVSVQDQQESREFINEVMRGHAQLAKISFSDAVRQVSGSLTAEELLVFLDRIRKTGKVTYSRKRFQSFPAAQPIPFILKTKPAPKIAEQQVSPASAMNKNTDSAVLPASTPTSTAR